MTSESTPQFGDREPASDAASTAMQGNRSADTAPEMLLRRALWRRGLRYRLHVPNLPGRPDGGYPEEELTDEEVERMRATMRALADVVEGLE